MKAIAQMRTTLLTTLLVSMLAGCSSDVSGLAPEAGTSEETGTTGSALTVRVKIYSGTAFGGEVQMLPAGAYDVDRLQKVGDDAIRSVRLPVGWTVTLFRDANFAGPTRVVTADTDDLGAFKDKTSSLVVSAPEVVLYSGRFAGPSATLAPGVYEVSNLGLDGNKLRSLSVPAGWTVTLYKGKGLTGEATKLTSATALAASTQVASLRVTGKAALGDADMLPGASALGMGFNVLGSADLTSIKQQIFAHESVNADSYKFPGTGETYSLPDNTIVIPNVNSGGEVNVFRSKAEVQKHFATEASVEASAGAFSGQFDASYSETFNSNKSYLYSLYSFNSTGWDAVLADQSPEWLSDDFVNDADVATLPAEFTPENAEQFYRVFRKFGTHYVSAITAGGKLDYSVAVDSSFESNETKVAAKVSMEYDALFAAGSAKSSAEWDQLGKSWVDNRQVRFHAVGGDPGIIGQIAVTPQPGESDGDVVSAWTKSVMKNPSVVSFKLTPLSNVFSGAKEDAVKRAIASYTDATVSATGQWFCTDTAGEDSNCAMTTTIMANGSEIIPPMAPPVVPQATGVIQIALLDPITLQPILNKEYFQPILHPTPDVYRAIMKDINVTGGDGYVCVVAATAVNVTPSQDSPTDPSPEFRNWLASCGASQSKWKNNTTTYALVGKRGGPAGSAAEFLDHGASKGFASVSRPSYLPFTGTLSTVFPDRSRVAVANTALDPFCAIGLIESSFASDLGIGTGTLIREDGWVLTAAHNFVDWELGKARSATFAPRQNAAAPPRRYNATQIIVADEYTGGASPNPNFNGGNTEDASEDVWDLALIKVDRSALGRCEPIRPYAATNSELGKQAVAVYGYPGDKADGTMWGMTGVAQPFDDLLLYNTISTFNGQSGASVIIEKNNQLVTTGIHVAGSPALRANVAARLTDEKIEWIEEVLRTH